MVNMRIFLEDRWKARKKYKDSSWFASLHGRKQAGGGAVQASRTKENIWK